MASMRRIYDSGALARDDEDPFQPGTRNDDRTPQAARSLPMKTLSGALTPTWLRHRAISVSVTTPGEAYAVGDPVPFTVRMKNALPVPISVPTRSARLWSWAVEGHRDASHVPETASQDAGVLEFGRGEWKEFGRTWHGLLQVDGAEWVAPDPGEYTISAAINVAAPAETGVSDETTIEIS
jgi:hypothetical protein